MGGGKTELVRGIAKGVNSSDQVASPTFTISRQYRAKDKDLTIHHFDFYRLQEPELMQEELSEVLGIPNHVVVIEWAQSVKEALPEDRLVIEFSTTGEDKRNIQITAGRDHQHLLESL